MKRIVVLFVCLAGGLAAQHVKSVKDKANRCQMTVPANGTSDPPAARFVTSPDNKTTAVVEGLDPNRGNYQHTASLARQMYNPTKIVEESASRATAGSQDSTATLDSADTSFAADRRQIGGSVSAVK